jgi:hypothetical protein
MRFAFTAILLVSAASFVMAAPINPWPMPQSSIVALSAQINPWPMPQSSVIALSAPINPWPMPQTK